MLPPLDPAILRNNPKFELLYNHLTSSVLNHDGSSKAQAAGSSTSVFREELHAAQVQAAKSQILRNTLPQITHGVNELPDELQEVVEIIAAQLKTRLSLEERGLLDDDLEYFLNHISPIGKALSTQLSDNALQLAKIAYPQEPNPKTLQTKASSLPETLTTRRTALLQTRETLASSRFDLAATACAILSTHRELLESIIRVLEQTKYGSVARGMKARAEHLAVVAESMDAKLSVMKFETLSEIYTPEVQSALRRYKEHLDDTRMRLRQREMAATETLAKYEMAGNDMPEIADRYRSILKDMKTVKADISRLGGNV